MVFFSFLRGHKSEPLRPQKLDFFYFLQLLLKDGLQQFSRISFCGSENLKKSGLKKKLTTCMHNFQSKCVCIAKRKLFPSPENGNLF